LAALFALAGVLHLLTPQPFLSITPDWVPAPEAVIRFTGLAELAGAAGLLAPRLRQAAGIGLALYAVCVYPANIKHAIDQAVTGGETMSWTYHGPRLMLQPLIVWWALWAGGVTRWPLASGAARNPSDRQQDDLSP
jgi:uncharacterized membrane protein